MPPATKKPCAQPGCPHLTTRSSRCDDHTTQHNWSHSATFEQRYQMSRSEFNRLRLRVLKRDQHTCYLCAATDCVTADHITPVAEGGAHKDTRNWATICTDCHREKTRREATRGQRRARTQHDTLRRDAEPPRPTRWPAGEQPATSNTPTPKTPNAPNRTHRRRGEGASESPEK